MTEKNYNPQQRNSKAMQKQEAVEQKANVADAKKKEEVKTEVEKKEKKQIVKVKKDEAVVNGISFPISTKDSVAICKFIKNKPLDKAIEDLEQVEKFKKVIPMNKGFPHRKGKGIMAGRYHTKPVGFFIRALKDLKANANMNSIDEPIIVEAIPNRASRPYGRFGRVKRKRTHIHIKVMEKSKLKELHQKKQKKKNKSGDKK